MRFFFFLLCDLNVAADMQQVGSMKAEVYFNVFPVLIIFFRAIHNVFLVILCSQICLKFQKIGYAELVMISVVVVKIAERIRYKQKVYTDVVNVHRKGIRLCFI